MTGISEHRPHLEIGRHLGSLSPEMLRGIRRGIEKESLRVAADGMLATTPHPRALGSALTHPSITTDFCEAQPELVTGVHDSIESCLEELTDIHRFVQANIGEEILWAASMPCRLPADESIPVGQYGTSNIGRIKTIYRLGLGHRYGRPMQTISGIHYNFSLPDSALAAIGVSRGLRLPLPALKTELYFGLIRNFRRHVWLLLYLFGASPAACSTFLAGRRHELQALASGTLYLPFATSLRMGSVGYQSDVQSKLSVSYNSLEGYTAALHQALTEVYPPYQAIGIRDNGGYRQLSDTILQIENEFYGTIRPKSPVLSGERTLAVLAQRGVEYVEVRSVDLDPYCPVGVAPEQLHFLDVFLLFCLLSDSPPDSPDERLRLAENQRKVVSRGREPDLRLALPDGGDNTLRDWGLKVMDACAPIAAALDKSWNNTASANAIALARSRLKGAVQTPSGRVLEDVHGHEDSFFRFAMERSEANAHYLRRLGISSEIDARYRMLASESLIARQRLEQADTLSFEDYRLRYLVSDQPPTPATHDLA